MHSSAASIRQGLVIFANNKQKLSAFYRQTLGLQIIESTASHDLLQGSGIALVIHAIPSRHAAHIEITEPPQVREDSPLKPTFVVADLAQVRCACEATGGWLKPMTGAWHIRGAIVLDGHDPEGNVVQFKQYANSQ